MATDKKQGNNDYMEEEMETDSFLFRICKNTKTVIRVLRQGGFPLLKQLIQIKLKKPQDLNLQYKKWIKANEKDIKKTVTLEYNPLISVVVPVYNVEENMLRECIESVVGQTYTNWQLCMADDASTWDCTKEVLKEYETHARISIVYRTENGHISKATNSAIELAEGEFIAFMDCDDRLAPNALYEVARKLNENPDYDFIYSDEDKIDETGEKRHFPHFKPDWSPDTLMSYMYTCHLGVYRTTLTREIGMIRPGYEGAQDYDFTLRFTEATNRIAHIPKVLYHWRERKESTSADVSAKPYVFEAMRKAKEDALKRRGLEAKLEFVENAYQYRVNYVNLAEPKISIIICSKDNPTVLQRCVESIHRKSSYKNYEIIVVDNGSTPTYKESYESICQSCGAKYFHQEMTFNFSRMCNWGAREATGDVYLFLNDDTKVLTQDWLERLVGQATLSHVGAVGAKLYYPNSKKIQHCGVINLSNGPSHIFSGMNDECTFGFARNKIDFNYLAVTGACLMVTKEKYDQVGGFDEELAVAYNDVELCLSLLQAGYYNVQRNDVKLYHYESLSRGYDFLDKEKMERLNKERNKMWKKQPEYQYSDPFYSPNLTQVGIDCSISVEKS